MFESLLHRPDLGPCPFGKVLAGLDPDDRAMLEKATFTKGVSVRRVVEAVQNELKIPLGRDAVQSHRTGTCRCSRL